MKIKFAVMRTGRLSIDYSEAKECERFDTYEEAEKEIERRLEKKGDYSREFFIQKIFCE